MVARQNSGTDQNFVLRLEVSNSHASHARSTCGQIAPHAFPRPARGLHIVDAHESRVGRLDTRGRHRRPFDAAWSIWVLEHVPNPEAALMEMRRILKSGALLFLMPAWEVKPWVAQGYEIRSYNELGVRGKLVKASIPIQNTLPFWLAATVPARAVRSVAAASGPIRLHYRRLSPNYEQYSQADSDAVNSLDVVETALWFQSRGDECLNCPTGVRRLLQPNYHAPLIIRIRKPANRLS